MIFVEGEDDKVYLFSDTRACVEIDGETYYSHDGVEKAKVIGDKIIFGMGRVDAVNYVFDTLRIEYGDLSYFPTGKVKEVAIDAYNKYNHDELGIYALETDISGKYVFHTFASELKFEIESEFINNGDIFGAGANSDKALEYIESRLGTTEHVYEIIRDAYRHVTDEKVGGACIIHELDVTEDYKIKFARYESYIDDTESLRKLPHHARPDGRAKFKKMQLTDGKNTALLDSESKKFYMNNWDIEGVGSLDAQFIQAGTLTVDDGFINNLTVNALKTLNKSDTIGSSIDYVHAKDNYIKLITGTITDRIQAKDSNDKLLYWTDASKSKLTNTATLYPFYKVTYDPIEKFILKLEGTGADSYPVMQWGRGDNVTQNSAKGFIKKETDNLGITYHRSHTGAVRKVELGDLGITIKAEDNGDITIEGRNITLKSQNTITFDAQKYDFK
jgi:hypothetical protein